MARGRALGGTPMREALHALARGFDRVAVPEHGRYVDDTARREQAPPGDAML